MIPVKTQFVSNYNIRYLIGFIKEKYATWKALARKQDKLSSAQLDAINSLATSGTLDASKIPNLDASKITTGVIDIDRLPQGALERLVTVANQSARFALTTANVQLGDTVKQTDTGVMYIVTDTANLANNNGYTEYTAGSATSVPWSGVTGKPSFASVATSGSYNDLTDKPTIPTVPTNYVTTDTTQTVSGQKTWTGSNRFRSFGVQSANTIDITQSTYANSQNCGGIGFSDTVNRFWGDIELNVKTDAASEMIFNLSNWKANGDQGVTALRFRYDKALTTVDFFGANGITNLGTSTNQWASVYAQTYYYNGTEFQNKFVTVDTNQTITGDKTFTGNNAFTHDISAVTDQTVSITENPPAEIIGNNFRFIDNDRFWGQFIPVWGTDGSFCIDLGISNWTTTGNQGYWTLSTKISKDFGTLSFYTSHANANLGAPSNSWNTVWTQAVRAPGTSNALILAAMETWEDGARIFMYGKDNANGSTIYADIDHNDSGHTKTAVQLDINGFFPAGTSRHLGLADANNRWLTFNGINPGALSLHNFNAAITLDTTNWDTTGEYGAGANFWTPTVNGWLTVLVNGTPGSGWVQLSQADSLGQFSVCLSTGYAWATIPVVANWQCKICLLCSTVVFAKFYPCQGNV